MIAIRYRPGLDPYSHVHNDAVFPLKRDFRIQEGTIIRPVIIENPSEPIYRAVDKSKWLNRTYITSGMYLYTGGIDDKATFVMFPEMIGIYEGFLVGTSDVEALVS